MDPYRRAGVDGCNVCHMSAEGGDERNPFGMAFAGANTMITPMLRAQFQDRFGYPVSRTNGMVIHFSDPADRQVVIEAAGGMNVVDVDNRTVNGIAAAAPGSTAAPAPVVPATALAAQATEVPVDPFAREGAFFGWNVVNLPNGKPQRAGGVDFVIAHRFAQDIEAAGLDDLYGFDSGAFVTYGVRVGLTDRITFAAMRNNFSPPNNSKTIELSSTLQASRQSETFPFTLQFRGGVAGKHNFGLYRESNFPGEERQYSPFVQAVAVHTVKDRVSFLVAPTFAFNTRDTNSPFPPELRFNEEHNHTLALGLGTGIRFLDSTSIVGEFIPRLHGFQGEVKDYPGLSVGLQHSTFRHTFEFVVSRQPALVTPQYAFQSTDTFRVGFNIYRKLR
jgi:hypothetical protein